MAGFGGDQPKHPNRMYLEKSPFLAQHKGDAVWWQTWGLAAFNSAREQDKPIFLSVGYSTCHWCSEMNDDCFQDVEVPDLMNQYFVSILADREELPDVDDVYMRSVQAMGEKGGWPLSLFLTPDLKPFFAATFLPKASFAQALKQVARMWQKDRPQVLAIAEQLNQHLTHTASVSVVKGPVDNNPFKRVWHWCMSNFDPVNGGFGGAPKFPSTSLLRVLLRIHRRTGNLDPLNMVQRTLDRMCSGALYDHVGGGFFRHAKDDKWCSPCFEKTLPDNALLAITYLEAYQTTRSPTYMAVAEETLQYIIRDLMDPDGGFYTAEHSDSEGMEGKFYMWNTDEVKAAAYGIHDDVEHFKTVFGMMDGPNEGFSGQVLDIVSEFSWAEKQVPAIKSILTELREVRAKRKRPFLDTKKVTAYNGLAIEALALGARVLGGEEFLEAAQSAAKVAFRQLWSPPPVNRLARRYVNGDSSMPAKLDDFAYLIAGLIQLFQADHDVTWIQWAVDLQQVQDRNFWSDQLGAYFFSTNADAQFLLFRRMDFVDPYNTLPNPNGVSALNNMMLHPLAVDEEYRLRAVRLLATARETILRAPELFGGILMAQDAMLDQFRAVVIVGNDKQQCWNALEMINAPMDDGKGNLLPSFYPNQVVAIGTEDSEAALPLLDLKSNVSGSKAPTIYICDCAHRLASGDPIKGDNKRQFVNLLQEANRYTL